MPPMELQRRLPDFVKASHYVRVDDSEEAAVLLASHFQVSWHFTGGHTTPVAAFAATFAADGSLQSHGPRLPPSPARH
jgi:hypothetical protein